MTILTDDQLMRMSKSELTDRIRTLEGINENYSRRLHRQSALIDKLCRKYSVTILERIDLDREFVKGGNDSEIL